MAFTTATVKSSIRNRQQFQGAFSHMWEVNLTVDPASIAATGHDTATFTIPGVALGDIVIGWSAGVDLGVGLDVMVYVSAANTLSISLYNNNPSVTAIDLASSTWKILIGHPTW